MRIAVIGTSGQLGYDLARVLPGRGHEVIGFAGRAELDICDAGAFAGMLEKHRPWAVINTAAFHNVDLCEKETDAAFRTNVVAVREMAKACDERKVVFVHISTDYVMEGAPAYQPIPEHAAVFPKSIYAVTRHGGECMALIHAPKGGYVVRSCGLFGIAGCKLKGGKNFVDTMIAMAREGKPLRVVNDQIVAPTATEDLSLQLAMMLEAHARGPEHAQPGLYHAVSHGEVSWFDFARTALEMANVRAKIEPVPSSAYAAPAQRPVYSVLDNMRLRSMGLDVMKSWQDGLARYIRAKYGGG